MLIIYTQIFYRLYLYIYSLYISESRKVKKNSWGEIAA